MCRLTNVSASLWVLAEKCGGLHMQYPVHEWTRHGCLSDIIDLAETSGLSFIHRKDKRAAQGGEGVHRVKIELWKEDNAELHGQVSLFFCFFFSYIKRHLSETRNNILAR